MDKVHEQIEWLSELGYSHYQCMRTMEVMHDVCKAAKAWKDALEAHSGGLISVGAYQDGIEKGQKGIYDALAKLEEQT